MARAFPFDDLVIFEMANNHQGSVAHGVRIVRAMAELTRRHDVRGAVKLQMRDLDTFLHPSALRDGHPNKHVRRFVETRLDLDGFRALHAETRAHGLVTMCTPFDEPSAARVRDLGFDVLKIGSCSARDWPLLEAAAATGLPMVVSTGGCSDDDVDNLVSFLEHRGATFALMHCVALYPTPDARMRLERIDAMRRRYPGVPIGWSTHEAPDDTSCVQIAVAKGASLFERHVGLVDVERAVSLNAYSSTPEQIDRWLAALVRARALCGASTAATAGTEPSGVGDDGQARDDERSTLADLERGVFARRTLVAGTVLARDDVYFAFPRAPAQLTSGAFRVGARLTAEVSRDAAIAADVAVPPPMVEEAVLKRAIHRVKALLNEARVPLSSSFAVEYSHHEGLARFDAVGAVLITCVERAYVKKIIVQLPGQRHPEHYHRRKEETFQVLWGTLDVEVDGHRHVLGPGDTALIQPGVFHSFSTVGGCVFEELSTRDDDDESRYRDPHIDALPRAARKTIVDHWGRFTLRGPVP